MIEALGTFFELLQVIVGLFTLLTTGMLLRRRRDRDVEVLLTWGAWTFASGTWNVIAHRAFYSHPTLVAPPWVNTVSAVFRLGGPILLYSVMLYAVWRFWEAGRHT